MSHLKVLVSSEGMSREEWLSWRLQGLGGSDAAACCGFSKFRSPLQLWLEKTGQIESTVSNEAMEWGNKLEPVIREVFQEKTGWPVETAPAIYGHEQHDFMFGNFDGFTIDPDLGRCVLEIKTAGMHQAPNWEFGGSGASANSGVPLEYELQCLHYLAVCGPSIPAVHVACLLGGQRLILRKVMRDEETIRMLERLETAFWWQVKNLIKPSWDGSTAGSDLLSRLYPKGQPGSKIILPTAADDLVQQFMAYKSQEESLSQLREKAEQELKALLGEHEVGETPSGHRICWKTVTSNRLDSKKLKAEHPDLSAQYSSESVSRRFTVGLSSGK